MLSTFFCLYAPALPAFPIAPRIRPHATVCYHVLLKIGKKEGSTRTEPTVFRVQRLPAIHYASRPLLRFLKLRYQHFIYLGSLYRYVCISAVK